MKGFFTKKQTESKSRYKNKSLSCPSCGLYRYSKSPKMESTGLGKKKILIIGEYPSKVDDKKNKHFQGSSGRLFQQQLRNYGIDMFDDCKCIYAINCRPLNKKLKKKDVQDYEIQCCKKRIEKILIEFKPKLIFLVGTHAITSFLQNRWEKNLGGIKKWRGFVIPDRDYKAFVCPVFSPKEVVLNEKNPAYKKVWKLDIKNALSYLKKPFPVFKDEKSLVEIIDIRKLAKYISFTGVYAFDYETTGLKPHAKGHRIICGSIASESGCFSFMMGNNKKDRKYFLEFLESNYTKKIAHNLKFEDAWTKVRLNTNINNWYWDTMIGAKILDNRNGTSGLKFQTYINFGVVNYDSSISEFLKGDDKQNANSFNRIHEADEDELLLYCGLDSLFSLKLAEIQMNKLGYDNDIPI